MATDPKGQPQEAAGPDDPAFARALLYLGEEYDAADVQDGYTPGTSAISSQTLDTLLAIALKILQQCASGQIPGGGGGAAGVAARAKRPGILGRLRVRRAVANELQSMYGPGAYFTQRGDRITQAILSAGARAEPADLEPLLLEAV